MRRRIYLEFIAPCMLLFVGCIGLASCVDPRGKGGVWSLLYAIICWLALDRFKKTQTRHEQPTSSFKSKENEEQKKGVMQRLEKIIQDFQKKAVAYFLFIESNKRSLSLAQEQHLFSTYGKVFALPYVDFYNEFKELENYDLIDLCVKEYLQQQHVPISQEKRLTNQLEDALLKQSENQAVQIINNLH